MSLWLSDLLPPAEAMGLVGIVLWALIALTFTVLVAVWIGRDAVERDLPAPWAFCLAAAFQPLVVLLVYLGARSCLAGRAAAPAPRTA